MHSRNLVENYLLARTRSGARKGTIANLRWALHSFTESIGDRPLDRIGSSDVERWLEGCGGYSPASRRAMLSAVRGFLRWCERRKYVRRNAANDVKAPRMPRMLPRALVSGSAEKLLAG